MDFVENVEGGGFIDNLGEAENVVIEKSSTVIVISPKAKSKQVEQTDDGCEEEEETEVDNEAVEGQCDESVGPPSVGMLFGSWKDVECYFKRYGKQQGFGVSRVQGVCFKDKSKRGMTWRCECWGDPDMRTTRLARKRAKEMEVGGSTVVQEGKKRNRRSKKCNCPVMLYASVNEGNWVIKKVLLEHQNHAPIPSQSRLVKEYRMQSFTSRVRRRILNDVDAGVPLSTTYASMAQERLGLEHMPFTEKDARHVVDKRRRLKMEGGDAKALVKYFRDLRRENINFYYAHRTDEHGYLKDIFWVEARSRLAYEEFGDVVCFDTTYLTNEYKLPFANFVGVNHHGQSTLLGCALISSEDCETYHWVFSEWLLCMRGKAPLGILTDQAAAFRGPLEELMPNTTHRWCIWHILQKLPKKCGRIKSYDAFSEELLAVIYNSFTADEFQSSWNLVLSNYEVEKDEKAYAWLSNLFEERHMWVPTYMKDYFWAGMRTTQRVESINRFFDQFINKHTRLFEFGERYTAAVKKRALQEIDADEADDKWWRKKATGFAVEKQFRKLYTDAKYCVVQRECEKVLYVEVREEIVVGTNEFVFLLEDRVWVLPKGCSEEVLTERRRMYSVSFNSEKKESSCDCKMFETHGILCRHVIRVFNRQFVTEVPDRYILRRWRRDVIRRHSKEVVGINNPEKELVVKRHDNVCKVVDPLVDASCLYPETEKIAVKGITKVLKEVNEWIKKKKEKEKEASDLGSGGGVQDLTENGDETNSAGGSFGCSPSSTQISTQQTQASNVGAIPTPPSVAKPSVPTPECEIKDPPIPKKRGRPKCTRFKGLEEFGWKNPTTTKKKKSKKEAVGVALNQMNSSLKGYVDSGGFEKQIGMAKLAVMRKVDSVARNESLNEYGLIDDNDPLLQRNAVSFEDGNI